MSTEEFLIEFFRKQFFTFKLKLWKSFSRWEIKKSKKVNFPMEEMRKANISHLTHSISQSFNRKSIIDLI